MKYWNSYPPYVRVSTRKANATRKLAELKKKNPDIQPVIIEGRNIAKTWWGQQWNKNLERYADYSNRIGRGSSYVRNGMVLDLRIEPGKINALVQGTSSNPYRISIYIRELNSATWENIIRSCEGQFDSLSELLEGKFPKSLAEIFTAKGEGLFPSPKDIRFECSCPDWAHMCKHVAASLYGVGARLDKDPMLFFKLRNVDVNDLIQKTVKEKTRSLLEKAQKKSDRIMEHVNLEHIFGIELDELEIPSNPTALPDSSEARKPEKNKPAISGSKKTDKKPKPDKTPKVERQTAIQIIEQIILKSKNGLTLESIEKKTGFDPKKVYQAVYRLKKMGKIVQIKKRLKRVN